MSPAHRITFLSALALAACQGLLPPRPETLARLRPMPLASAIRGRFELELQGPGLSGTFDAVCAVEGRCCRLQLFPDIGAKIFDLRLEEATIAADGPWGHYEAKAPLDDAAPHLALVLGVMIAELLCPVQAARVIGERPGSDGRTQVSLLPALGSGVVVATLAAEGEIETYAITLGHVAFTVQADGSLRGRGIAGQLRFPGG
ncbi:MAG TPA: hypothetical protein VFD82_13530 [Planctomycetota bacterium]|nr:hypothetical protein [Planctomycetota bacterium]